LVCLLLSFFRLLQMRRTFSKNKNSFNPCETLLWNDVILNKDHVKIWIKIPKSKNPKGEHIELFSCKGHNCCPLLSIKNLKSSTKQKLNMPVFTFENGKFLTIKSFNLLLKSFLSPHIGNEANNISGHSFRAAVPSLLAVNPNIANDDDIQKWGRWNSSCFTLYTKLSLERKRNIFNKIVDSLNN